MKRKRRHKILVVDDEIGIRELLSDILGDEGYQVVTAHNAASAWHARGEEMPDLILLDIWMPDMDGVTLLKQWKDAGFSNVPVIVMSGHATIESAVEATKQGAAEVMEKPIATERLLSVIAGALAGEREVDVNPALQQADFGESPAMKTLKKALLQASGDTAPVLLVGPPNGGALFFAQFLARPKTPTVFVNSGAELERDLDSLLRSADGGLCIVRLADLFNAVHQNGLLGLLREGRKRDIRVAVCSMEMPEVLAEKHGFSDVLAAILARRVIEVPLLGRCKIDLPAIVDLICARLTENTDMAGRQFAPAAKLLLTKHAYENDFAELISVVRSALLYTSGGQVRGETVQMMLAQFLNQSSALGVREDVYTMPFRRARMVFEAEYFNRLIGMTDGNIPRAAEIAQLERTYFYRKLKQYKEGAGGGDGGEAA